VKIGPAFPLVRAAPGPQRPRRGCRGLRVVGAVLVYLAASQGPVVAELVHQADHLLRSPNRTRLASEGEALPPGPHSHGRSEAPSNDHSHGTLLDGILAAAEEAGEPSGVAMAPAVPLHLPGAPPVEPKGIGEEVTAPPESPLPILPAALRVPPTPPPQA
jgi:hypothetical protein